MSKFFPKETKNRILTGVVAGVLATSSLLGATTAFAEDTQPTTPVTTVTTVTAGTQSSEDLPAAPTTGSETPATPTASTEESTPGAFTPTEETSTVTVGTPSVAEPPAGAVTPAETTEKWNYVFDTNGGTFADGSITKTVTLNLDSASVNSPATPSKPGMTFAGWSDIQNSDIKGTKGVYTVDASNAYETSTIDANGNVTHTRTLYAVYKLNINITGATEQPVYRFDANGGHAANGTDTIVEVPATSGMTDDNVPAPTVVRDGYDFIGWGKSSSSTAMSNLGVTNVNFVPAIADEMPMTLDNDHNGHVYHTVYAIWKQSATPTPTPTPEPENPPTPSNPDTPVVPDNPQPENPVNPQPDNPATPDNPVTPGTDTPQPGGHNEPITPAEPSAPGTDTPQPGTGTSQSGTETPKPGSDNTKQAVDNNKPTTDKPTDKSVENTTHKETSSRKSALPDTGDATVTGVGLMSMLGSVLALFGLNRKRK